MFNEFPAKGGSFSIHDHNLQKLLMEMFKPNMNLVPEIMNEVSDILLCPKYFAL